LDVVEADGTEFRLGVGTDDSNGTLNVGVTGLTTVGDEGSKVNLGGGGDEG
jgi:hypothetical protein